LEHTIVKSNCDVAFPAGGLTYNIPADGTGDRSAALTTVRSSSQLRSPKHVHATIN
jgi:hypothetical protein